MGSRTEIEQRIWDAADSLHASLGRRPTVAEVREEAKADQTRVSKIMQVWRRRMLEAASTRGVPLPEPIRGEMGRIVERVWERALEATADAHAAVLAAERDADRMELEASVAQLSSENRALQERLDEAEARERSLIERAARAEQVAAQAARREAAARKAQARLEAERDELREAATVMKAERDIEAWRLTDDLAEALELAERRANGFEAWLSELERSSRKTPMSGPDRLALLDEARAQNAQIVQRLRELRGRIGEAPGAVRSAVRAGVDPEGVQPRV